MYLFFLGKKPPNRLGKNIWAVKFSEGEHYVPYHYSYVRGSHGDVEACIGKRGRFNPSHTLSHPGSHLSRATHTKNGKNTRERKSLVPVFRAMPG